MGANVVCEAMDEDYRPIPRDATYSRFEMEPSNNLKKNVSIPVAFTPSVSLYPGQYIPQPSRRTLQRVKTIIKKMFKSGSFSETKPGRSISEYNSLGKEARFNPKLQSKRTSLPLYLLQKDLRRLSQSITEYREASFRKNSSATSAEKSPSIPADLAAVCRFIYGRTKSESQFLTTPRKSDSKYLTTPRSHSGSIPMFEHNIPCWPSKATVGSRRSSGNSVSCGDEFLALQQFIDGMIRYSSDSYQTPKGDATPAFAERMNDFKSNDQKIQLSIVDELQRKLASSESSQSNGSSDSFREKFQSRLPGKIDMPTDTPRIASNSIGGSSMSDDTPTTTGSDDVDTGRRISSLAAKARLIAVMNEGAPELKAFAASL